MPRGTGALFHVQFMRLLLIMSSVSICEYWPVQHGIMLTVEVVYLVSCCPARLRAVCKKSSPW
jgi:putative effector of murein hydrolase LrgA (UPF0299 family)